MSWESVFQSTLALYLIMDPLGNAPVVQNLLNEQPVRRRTPILIRELVLVLVLLLIFFLAGKEILGYMGLHKEALNISGGIMLLLIAVGMVFPHAQLIESPESHHQKHEPFLVPIGIPLIVGPAAISYVMIMAAQQAGSEGWLGALIGLVCAWAATAATMLGSRYLLDRLGDRGSIVLTRLMGTLLVLIAVQMCLNGITDYINHLNNAG